LGDLIDDRLDALHLGAAGEKQINYVGHDNPLNAHGAGGMGQGVTAFSSLKKFR
jgi:hypothetical protein